MKRTLLLLPLLCFACDGAPADDEDGGEGPGLGDGGVLGDAGERDPQTRPDMAGEVEDEGPVVNSIVPNRADVAGGARLRVVGSGFRVGSVVKLGSLDCEDVEVVSEFRIECTVPASNAPGTVRVVVRWPLGGKAAVVEDGFTWFQPVELRSAEPARGPARGGVEVEIDGRGFVEPSLVYFGEVQATIVEIRNPNRMTVVSPESVAGTVDLVVRNVNGDARLEGAFTYVEALDVADLSPRWGYAAGGDEVVLSGTGLPEDTEVRFGGEAARVMASELDRARLRVETPAHAAGAVGVEVSNANGEWAREQAFLYVERAGDGFGVDGVVPSRVPSTGGARFLVGGRGFTPETRVEVDGELVPCDVVAPEVLSCLAPPHDPGVADVAAVDGERRDVLEGALRYFHDVQILDVRPARGSVAGGTVVELLGRGFSDGMAVTLDGQALSDVEVVDDGERAFARTPPGRAGLATLQVQTADDTELLPDAYEYFRPTSRFGGIWGDPIEHTVNVTVLDSCDGSPLEDAHVVVVDLTDGDRFDGRTDVEGMVTISDLELSGPVAVTAAQVGFDVTTFERATAENITVYLFPLAGCGGGGGGGDPPALVSIAGTLVGLDEVEKPRGDGLVLAAFVEASHTSLYNRWNQPFPDHRGVLLEDGAFEISMLPGERAIVVTAAWVDGAQLDAYLGGQRELYRPLRSAGTPKRMGVQRFISASPGERIEGIEVRLDKSRDLSVPVTLDNPSGGVPGAPDVYTAVPYIDFGPEGYWELESSAEGGSPLLESTYMPTLDEWDGDIEIQWYAIAQSSDPVNPFPYTETFETSDDLADGVVIGPWVGTAEFVRPIEDDAIGPEGIVEWAVHPGVDGPTTPAHVHLLVIDSAVNRWTYFVPGAAERYQFPSLPVEIDDPLQGDLRMMLVSILVDGRFDYDDFGYGDIGFSRRKSYSVTQIRTRP